MRIEVYKMIRRANLVLLILLSFATVRSSMAAVAPEWAIALNNEGVRALNKSQWEKAIEKLSAAVLVDPKYDLARKNLSTAHNNFGLYLFNSDDTESFKQFHYAVYFYDGGAPLSNLINMTQRMGRNSQRFEDHLMLGDKFRERDDLISAAVEYRAALKLRFSTAIDKKLRATETLISKQRTSKLQSFDESQLEDIGDSESSLQDYIKVASLLRQHGRWKYATQLILKCIQARPDDESVWLQLSRCYIAEKKFDDAESTLMRARERFTDSLSTQESILKMLIECHIQTGNLEKLLCDWTTYLTKFPNSTDAKLVKEQLRFYEKDFAEIRRLEAFEDKAPAKISSSILLKIYIQKNAPIAKDSVYTKMVLARYGKLAEKAIEEWRAATKPRLSFAFENDEKRADIVLAWTTDLSKRKQPFFLGQTESLFDTNSRKHMRHAVIFLDPKHLISDTEFYETCLHEFGHALNLKHSSHPEDIMYWAADVNTSDVHAKHLSQGDIDRIRQLY